MGTVFSAYKKSLSLDNLIDSEFYELIEDLIATEEVKSLADYVQHYDINRLQHVMSVAYLSFLVCKKLRLDTSAAARAGLLHDLFYYDWHEKDDGSHRLHGYRHPAFAAENAKKLTTISKKEENIILRHMWPLTLTPPKYRESFVVTMSDKYCATVEIVYSISEKYNLKFMDLGLKMV
ncbi:MAG: HDIG domain-containing protein [Oscillospiraceae bacterium]